LKYTEWLEKFDDNIGFSLFWAGDFQEMRNFVVTDMYWKGEVNQESELLLLMEVEFK